MSSFSGRALERRWVRFGVEVGERSKGENHCFHKAVHLLKAPIALKNMAI